MVEPVKQNGCILAFDFGEKNIGVASGHTLMANASPLQVIENHRGTINWQAIEKVIAEWQPVMLLLGLPFNMDGSETALVPRIQKFSRQLQGRFNLPVEFHDERLSTQAAKDNLERRSGFADKPVDAEAAAVILQGWFDSNQ